ncbi:MAG: sodium:glutamate symporter [Bacteroidales bacterium]|nr:sodium:glutamate symporter [Bacteroidales bacterium]
MTAPVFTPWTLFTDLGLIGLLLLIGKLVRVKVKLVQKLFIPPSLIAGLLGLVLGPEVLGWLPFSNFISVYPAILIALVFGALPLSSDSSGFKSTFKRVVPLWAYSQFGMLFQWGIMGIIGIVVFKAIWPELNDAFGIMLSTGYYGGHGTAAAIGSAFENGGWNEAASLGMTTATVGVVLAIIGGLAIIKAATKRGDTRFITDFDNLPSELRTGLIPEEKRESSGKSTTSAISIESLTFHFSLVLVSALGGYLLSLGVKKLNPSLDIPVFSAAFVVGILLKLLFSKTKVTDYIDRKTVYTISSFCTDILVACGVASIKLSVVVKYAVPLICILIVGALIVYFTVFFFGRRVIKNYWFEKSIFAWGWWTGTMAMGIALLRLVDPKQESKSMDDYALAYLPCAPVEILLITFVPIMFLQGHGLIFSVICALIGIAIILPFLIKKKNK